MATVTCKQPGCDCVIDTTLACKNVTSLFGLRYQTEATLKNISEGTPEHTSLSGQLHYLQRQLHNLRVPEIEAHYTLYHSRKSGGTAAPPR